MKSLLLTRNETGEEGTFGELTIEGQHICHTLELPWEENKHTISCILTGHYICEKYSSEKHPRTYQITNVPGRDKVLFHIANTIKDLRGCVGVGDGIGQIDGLKAIVDSRKAFIRFLDIIDGDEEFALDIVWKDELTINV